MGRLPELASAPIKHGQEHHLVAFFEDGFWSLVRVNNPAVENDDDVCLNLLVLFIENGFSKNHILCRKTTNHSQYRLTF